MQTVIRIAAIFLAVVSYLPLAFAQDYNRGTPQQAFEMVQEVKKKYLKDGPAKTIIAINTASPEFFKGDLYPFIVRMDGVMIAHYFPPVRGQNMMQSRDRKGVFFFQEMVKAIKAKGKGWISYDFVNPVTGKWNLKIVYVEKLDNDHFAAVGVYRKVTDL